MTPEHLAQFNKATILAATNPNQAYQLLKALEREGHNYSDTNLLAWLIFTAPAYPEKEYWVERAHTIAPTETAVLEAIAWFRQQSKPASLIPQSSSTETRKYSHRNSRDESNASITRRTRHLSSLVPLVLPTQEPSKPVFIAGNLKINKSQKWIIWVGISCLILVSIILVLNFVLK